MARIRSTVQIENRNAILELLTSGKTFRKIYIAEGARRDERVDKILKLARQKGVPIEKTSQRAIRKLSKAHKHESLIGVLEREETISLDELLEQKSRDSSTIILLLNKVDYPQNLGAILRTAYGAGVSMVIVPSSRGTELNEEVTRVSMGASERIPVVRMGIYDAMKKIHKAGIRIVGVDMNGRRNYSRVNLRGPVGFLIGGEDEGLSKQLLERCDETVNIPMAKDLGSLNVSVATGIVLFESLRQQNL